MEIVSVSGRESVITVQERTYNEIMVRLLGLNHG